MTNWEVWLLQVFLFEPESEEGGFGSIYVVGAAVMGVAVYTRSGYTQWVWQ